MQDRLWEYATKIYGAEGVAPACLALQDQFGLDVNFLLYAAWLAHADKRLSVEHLISLDASISDWRDQVVWPLRTARRHLHGKALVGDLYDAVKALELRAEREQLDKMYAFSRQSKALPGADRPLLDNLKVVARSAYPADEAWEPAIAALAALIPP